MTEKEINEVAEAAAFVEQMAQRADIQFPYPAWYGWALREAYLAGRNAARATAFREAIACVRACGVGELCRPDILAALERRAGEG